MVDWYVESEAADILDWLCRKMNNAMILNMESGICSKWEFGVGWRGHRKEETKKNKEDEEISVFTYLVRRNKSLYGECKKRKKRYICLSNALHFFIIIIIIIISSCILPKSDRIFVLDKVRLVYFIIYLQKVLVNYTYRHLHSN